jgi:hypothetical protein
VPVPLPRAGADGRPLFHAPEKVRVLAEALMRAVSKEHDNELFVLFVDLLDLTDDVEPLVRAVKVAVARHHQVMVVLPWPRGLPLPETGGKQPRSVESFQLPGEAPYDAYRQLRKSFARFGVAVIPAAGDEPTRLILDRLERLRLVGGKR